jgi:hypothetical protein
MTGPGIGRLHRVPLREVWRHEAYDFTQWLEANIDVLNEVLDLTLVNVTRERRTESAFSVDLVAEDEGGGTVIIENQLGRSDHDHLGKLITYLSAMQARAAIWIVSEPRPEHVSAMTWLNESGGARFYLLKVEAISIAGSPPAPLLTVIVEPSEALTEIAQSRHENDERFNTRRKWWSRLLQRPDARLHSHIKPGGESWLGTSSGVRGLAFNFTMRQTSCKAELYIDRGKGQDAATRQIFEQLHANRAAIEASFGGPLEWQALEAKRACRISTPPIAGGYRSPEAEWDGIQSRQVDAMNRLSAALKPHLARLDLRGLDVEADEDEGEAVDEPGRAFAP